MSKSEYTGTIPEEMEGWGWQSVTDPVVLPLVLDRWKTSLATGKPFDMVFPLRGSDGTFRPYLTRTKPECDQDGKVVRWFGTNTDLTERERAQEELRQAKEAGVTKPRWGKSSFRYAYSVEDSRGPCDG
jgi:PAS domain-containing protein